MTTGNSNTNSKLTALQITEAIKLARELFDYKVELFIQQAKESKAEYDAFVDAGFTPEQALFLVKSK